MVVLTLGIKGSVAAAMWFEPAVSWQAWQGPMEKERVRYQPDAD